MEDVEKLLKGTVEELDRLLNAKNVLGDPIEREGSTVIPIVSYGFGFGAGGNVGAKLGSGAGTGHKYRLAIQTAHRYPNAYSCHDTYVVSDQSDDARVSDILAVH